MIDNSFQCSFPTCSRSLCRASCGRQLVLRGNPAAQEKRRLRREVGSRVSAHHGPGEATLTPLILVRIQVPKPHSLLILLHFISFRLRRNSSEMSAGYSPSITMVVFQRHKTAALRRAKTLGVSRAL